MIFISNGIPKSASSFAFLLCNQVANLVTPRQEISMRLPPHLRPMYFETLSEVIDELVELVPDNMIYVLKTHSDLDPKIRAYIEQGKAMASFAYRDPYDTVISLLDAGTRERQRPAGEQRQSFASILTLEDAIGRIPFMLQHGRTWLDHINDLPGTIRTPYEGLRKHPHFMVDEFARMFGVRVNTDAIVHHFLSDRQKIWEYNKGQTGRGHREYTLAADHPVKALMDQFNTDFPQP